MGRQKKKAAPATTGTTLNKSSSNTIISEAGTKVKTNLTMRSNVKTCAIKCYDEQLGQSWDEFKKRVAKIDYRDWIIVAIAHNGDYLNDDIYNPSEEKVHYHILVKRVDNKARELKQYLNMLGIVFRPGIDDNLFKQDGVTTVGMFPRYSLYLLHLTEKAIKDHKKPYSIDEMVTNLPMYELEKLLGGEKHRTDGIKITEELLSELDKEVYQIGYDLKDFEEWYQDLPFKIRARSEINTLRKTYEYGIDIRMSDQTSIEVNKLCIYIEGKGNIGKSYAARYALREQKVLDISGQKTGKFDSMKPSYDAVLIDDDGTSNVFQLCDNRYCKLYRRNKSNGLFCGDTVVITSNLPFEEWYDKCTNTTKNVECMTSGERESREAGMSRFYVCKVVNHTLKVISPSRRGTKEEQLVRKERFKHFMMEFNKSLNSYVPKDNVVDYHDLFDTDCAEVSMERDIKLESEVGNMYFDGLNHLEIIKSFLNGNQDTIWEYSKSAYAQYVNECRKLSKAELSNRKINIEELLKDCKHILEVQHIEIPEIIH